MDFVHARWYLWSTRLEKSFVSNASIAVCAAKLEQVRAVKIPPPDTAFAWHAASPTTRTLSAYVRRGKPSGMPPAMYRIGCAPFVYFLTSGRVSIFSRYAYAFPSPTHRPTRAVSPLGMIHPKNPGAI